MLIFTAILVRHYFRILTWLVIVFTIPLYLSIVTDSLISMNICDLVTDSQIQSYYTIATKH